MPGQPPQDRPWDDLLGPDNHPADVYAGLAEATGERRAYVQVPDGYARMSADERGAAALGPARELRQQLGI